MIKPEEDPINSLYKPPTQAAMPPSTAPTPEQAPTMKPALPPSEPPTSLQTPTQAPAPTPMPSEDTAGKNLSIENLAGRYGALPGMVANAAKDADLEQETTRAFRQTPNMLDSQVNMNNVADIMQRVSTPEEKMAAIQSIYRQTDAAGQKELMEIYEGYTNVNSLKMADTLRNTMPGAWEIMGYDRASRAAYDLNRMGFTSLDQLKMNEEGKLVNPKGEVFDPRISHDAIGEGAVSVTAVQTPMGVALMPSWENTSDKGTIMTVVALAMMFVPGAQGLAASIGTSLGASGVAATAIGQAVMSGTMTALQGGSTNDILKSALAGGIASYAAPMANAAGGAAADFAKTSLNLGSAAQNVVGSAVAAGTNTAIKGALNGNLSGKNVLASMVGGGLGSYVNSSVKDTFDPKTTEALTRTTNLVATQMTKGVSFDEALKNAVVTTGLSMGADMLKSKFDDFVTQYKVNNTDWQAETDRENQSLLGRYPAKDETPGIKYLDENGFEMPTFDVEGIDPSITDGIGDYGDDLEPLPGIDDELPQLPPVEVTGKSSTKDVEQQDIPVLDPVVVTGKKPEKIDYLEKQPIDLLEGELKPINNKIELPKEKEPKKSGGGGGELALQFSSGVGGSDKSLGRMGLNMKDLDNSYDPYEALRNNPFINGSVVKQSAQRKSAEKQEEEKPRASEKSSRKKRGLGARIQDEDDE